MINIRILSILILLVCQQSIYAQESYIDSLLHKENALQTDQAALSELYYKIGYYYKYSAFDNTKAIEYTQKAIVAGERAKSVEDIAKGNILLSSLYINTGQLDKANTCAWIAYDLTYDNHRLRYFVLSRLSDITRRKADYDSSLYFHLENVKLAEEHLGDTILGNVYNDLAGYYATTSNYEKSITYHQKALELRLENKDSIKAALSYNNLGIVCRMMGDYTKALEWYNKAKQIFVASSDSSDIAFIYNDIGAAHSKLGTLDSTDYYLKNSIAIRERINEQIELAYTYNYLGENYERMGKLPLAEAHIKKALQIAIDIQNVKQHIEALESLSDFFARNKMYDSAYKYAQLHKTFNDSISKLDNQRVIAELNAQYETEKKENIIQEQEFELQKKNYLIGIAVLILLSAVVIGYLLYRRSKLQQQAKLQASVLEQQHITTKAVLAAEENERQRIASDLHDGVGQMMSAAKINLSNIASNLTFSSEEEKLRFDNAVKLVDDSCAEVRVVSHNIMPNSLLRNSLADAVRAFISKIDQDAIKINLYTEGLNERINEDVEVMLYRVIQEAINNVIKHAQADTLDMTLIKEGNELTATIEDNGKGFDVGKTKDGGVGLKSIKSRVEYLKGTVEWDSKVGRGTAVAIHIPL